MELQKLSTPAPVFVAQGSLNPEQRSEDRGDLPVATDVPNHSALTVVGHDVGLGDGVYPGVCFMVLPESGIAVARLCHCVVSAKRHMVQASLVWAVRIHCVVKDGLNTIWHCWVLTLLDFRDVRRRRRLCSAMGAREMRCILWTCPSSWLVECISYARMLCLVIHRFWWDAGP